MRRASPAVDRTSGQKFPNSPGVEVDRVQEAIVLAAKISLRVEVDPVSEPIVPVAENSPSVETEARVSESAIGLAAKNRLNEESNQNPILTGITFSAGFLARYSPPQPGIIHFQSDADGQLSLLDFEIESSDEPPDPDDFESLDAFREDLALWDSEYPSSFDHFSDLPSSVHCEPSFVHCEPLEVSLDSFCEWAPCPADWYEPVALQLSKVIELSLTCKSSSTSDFFIPTFDRLGYWSDRSDEPPDTGIYASLPKLKPPSFPPTALGQAWVKRIPNASQTQLSYIPFISPLATTPSQDDRRRSVMPRLHRLVNMINLLILRLHHSCDRQSNGDRFFPPIAKKQQPMFSLKINIPTYKSNSWGQLERHGDLQVSSNVDSLSDGYAALKVQIDELLAQVKAEN